MNPKGAGERKRNRTSILLRFVEQPVTPPEQRAPKLARDKFSELKPHAKKLVTKYGWDYCIKKGKRPSEERKKIRLLPP